MKKQYLPIDCRVVDSRMFDDVAQGQSTEIATATQVDLVKFSFCSYISATIILIALLLLAFGRHTVAATVDTEIRITGLMGFLDQVFVSLELSNVQVRVHEIPPLLKAGDSHGDIQIKSIDFTRSLVVIETPSGIVQIPVGRTAYIHHVPFGRAAHRDELYARYGDFVPPGRFRSTE